LKTTLTFIIKIISTFTYIGLPCAALAEVNLCKAMAIKEIHAEEDSATILKKGDIDYAITQYRVNKRTKNAVFCSHGGNCYSAKNLKLINCNVGEKFANQSPSDEDIFYSVDLDRKNNSAKELKRHDVSVALDKIGLGGAMGDAAMEYYINKPESKCGLLAKKALNGDQSAIDAYMSGESCIWKY
jgi:hypothetical protein